MKAGLWHQLGYNTHRLAEDVTAAGVGSGVIIPATDMRYPAAQKLAKGFRERGAGVIFDHQLYVPDFSNARTNSYPGAGDRASVTSYNRLGPQDERELAAHLKDINGRIGATAVLAPGVVYQSNRADIVALNDRLRRVAQVVAESLGLPLYATVAIGNSVLTSRAALEETLSAATSTDCDGWYLAVEFRENRVPCSAQGLGALSEAMMALALTGKPVMHAFAGPMSLLSLGLGAVAAGVGPFQTLWQFDPTRYGPREAQGGGGDAPQRFFSQSLWGTVVFPDEFADMARGMLRAVYTESPFSRGLCDSGQVNQARIFRKSEAQRHLVWAIGASLLALVRQTRLRDRAQGCVSMLRDAVRLHRAIAESGLALKDRTDSYQQPWLKTLEANLRDRQDDYMFLEMVG